LLFSFFFSSRRRHTRFSRDWSSDVCSSDLGGKPPTPGRGGGGEHRSGGLRRPRGPPDLPESGGAACPADRGRRAAAAGDAASRRSEERRVGKEWRTRGGPWDREAKTGKAAW